MFLDYQLAYGTSLFQMKAALIEQIFLGYIRCLKHSQNCAMHLPHLLSKLDSLPFYPWPDLSENMTSRNLKLCLLKRAPCEHPISGEKGGKRTNFSNAKPFSSEILSLIGFPLRPQTIRESTKYWTALPFSIMHSCRLFLYCLLAIIKPILPIG